MLATVHFMEYIVHLHKCEVYNSKENVLLLLYFLIAIQLALLSVWNQYFQTEKASEGEIKSKRMCNCSDLYGCFANVHTCVKKFFNV